MMSISNGWNDKNENIVISIGENAASYKWMHERVAARYTFIYKIFRISLIILSTILAVESIIAIPDNLGIVISRDVITYVMTGLTVIINFLNYETLSEQHRNSAIAFSGLYHSIQQEMCMYRKDRKFATLYVANVLKDYDSFIVKGPPIDRWVIKQFKKTFTGSNIALPDIADRIQKIEIVAEPALASEIEQTDVQVNTPTNQTHQLLNIHGANNNLYQIHNAFKIQGDITDEDLQNASATELEELRQRRLMETMRYEEQRSRFHNSD